MSDKTTEANEGGSGVSLRQAKFDDLDWRRRIDGWQNIVTGMGREASDPRVHARVSTPESSNQEITWDNLYHGDDVAGRIADTHPKEMIRKWFEVSIEPSEDDADGLRTEDLTKKKDAETGLQEKLRELNAQEQVFEAKLWANVFGGSLLFLGVDDGGTSDESMAEPLNLDNVKSFTHLTVFNRFEVEPLQWYDDPREAKFGLPKTYTIQTTAHSGGASSQGLAQVEIHETRFIRFNGSTTSRRRKRNNTGWSDSIYVKIFEVIRDFAQTWGGVAAMLQDFKVSVYRLRGVADALKAGKDDLVMDRLRIMELCLSMFNALPLDEDEEYSKLSTNVQGLEGLLDKFGERLAMAADMPITLLMGRSPGGLNATGDADIRFFYDRVSSRQEIELRTPLELLCLLVWLTPDGPTGGKEPESWSLTFNALWQLNDLEESTRRKNMAEADKTYIDAGVLTSDEVAESRFGGEDYSIETKLDLKAREEAKKKDEESGGVEAEREEMRFMAEMAAANLANNGLPPAPVPPSTLPREDVEPPSSAIETDDHTHGDPNGGETGGVVETSEGFHDHERPDGLGRTEPAPNNKNPDDKHVHTTPDGNTGEDRTVFKFDNFRRRGPGDWVVTSNEGRVIGRHGTQAASESQIAHILESQGVIVERLSATEWAIVGEDELVIETFATRKAAAAEVNVILGRVNHADGEGKPVIYYAHAMTGYGSEQEASDIARLEALGFEVLNPATAEINDEDGSMEGYRDAVRASDALAYRANTPDGKTTSGVRLELVTAQREGIPVFELVEDASHPIPRAAPRRVRRRTPAFCKKNSPSYDAARCRRFRARNDKVEKRGEKYVVLNQAGDKVLGTHDTRVEALKQLAAIEANKE